MFCVCCALHTVSSSNFKNKDSTNATSSLDALKNMTFNTSIAQPTGEDEISGLVQWLYQINKPLSFLSCIPSSATAIMIWSYLNNVSPANEGILLDLYKDTVANLITIRLFMLYGGTMRIISIGDKPFEMNPIKAKITSFIIFAISFSFFLQLNVVSFLRLYIAKTKVLDPPMPWKDEKSGQQIIRAVVVTLSVVVPTILYSIGIYPKHYFTFVKDDNIPLLANLYSGSIVFLLIMFTLTVIVERWFSKRTQDQVATIIPYQLYFHLVPIILLNREFFEILFQVLEPNMRGEIYELLTSISGMTTPFVILLSSKKLSNYALKFVKELMEVLFFRSIYITPLMLSIFLFCSLNVVYWIFDV